jgi:hypothetical protein
MNDGKRREIVPEHINITEAKKSLKHQIKFFESLLAHIKRCEEPMLSRAMYASWCLHRYIQDQLMDDMEQAMKEHTNEKHD